MNRQPISQAEREVLEVLWDRGPLSSREIIEELESRGKEWSRSTIVTLIQRLEKKGYVESDKSGFAFVFSAAVSREDMMHERISELAREFGDGGAANLILSFAERHDFSEAEIARFRAMIDELTPKKKRRKK